MDTMSSTSSEGSYHRPQVRRHMDISGAARRLMHSFEEVDNFSLLRTSTQQLNEDIYRETQRSLHVEKQKASPRRAAPPPPRRAFSMPPQPPAPKPLPTPVPPPRALLHEVDYSPLTSPENLSLTRKQLSKLLAREKVLRSDLTRMPAHIPRPHKLSVSEDTERLHHRIAELEAMLLPQLQVAQNEDKTQIEAVAAQLQELEQRYAETCEKIAQQEKEGNILRRRLDTATRTNTLHKCFSKWKLYHQQSTRATFAVAAAQTDPYTPPATLVNNLRDEIQQLREINDTLTAKVSSQEIMLPFLSAILPKLSQSLCSKENIHTVAAEFVQWLRTLSHGDVALFKFKVDEFGDFLVSSDDVSSSSKPITDSFLSDIIQQGVVHNPSKPSTPHQINLVVPFLSADVKLIGDRNREFSKDEVDRLKLALMLFASWIALQKRLRHASNESTALHGTIEALKEEMQAAVSELETQRSSSELLQKRLPSMLGIFDLITSIDDCHSMEDIGQLLCSSMPQLLGHNGISASFVLRDGDDHVTYRVVSSSHSNSTRQYTPQQWRNIPSFDTVSLTEKQCTISFYDKDQSVFGGVVISRLVSADRVGNDVWNDFSWRGLEEKFCQCIRGVMTLAVQRLHMIQLETERTKVMEDVKHHVKICSDFEQRLREKDKEVKQLHEKLTQTAQELENISRDATDKGQHQRKLLVEYEERVSRLEDALAQKEATFEEQCLRHTEEMREMRDVVRHAEAEAKRLNNADVRMMQEENNANRTALNRLREMSAISQTLWSNGAGTISEYYTMLMQGCLKLMRAPQHVCVDGIVVHEEMAKEAHMTIDEYIWRNYNLEKTSIDGLLAGKPCRVGQMLFIPIRSFDSVLFAVVCLEKKFNLRVKDCASTVYSSTELQFSLDDEEIGAQFCNLSVYALHRLRTYEETRASIKQATLAIQKLQETNARVQDEFAVEVAVKLQLHETLSCGIDLLSALQHPKFQVMNLVSAAQQHICNITASESCYFIAPFDPEATDFTPGRHFLISRYGVARQISLEESDIEHVAMDSNKTMVYPTDSEYCWTLRNQGEDESAYVLCVPVMLSIGNMMLAVLTRRKEYEDVDVKVAKWFTKIASHVFRYQMHDRDITLLQKESEEVKDKFLAYERTIVEHQQREEVLRNEVQRLEDMRTQMIREISATGEKFHACTIEEYDNWMGLSFGSRVLRLLAGQFGKNCVDSVSSSGLGLSDDAIISRFYGVLIQADVSRVLRPTSNSSEYILTITYAPLPTEPVRVRIACVGLHDMIMSSVFLILKQIDVTEQISAQYTQERKTFQKAIDDITQHHDAVLERAKTDKSNMEKCLAEANSIYSQNLEAVKTKYRTTIAEKSKHASAACDFLKAFLRAAQHIQQLTCDMVSQSPQTKLSLSRILKRVSEILNTGGVVVLCGKLERDGTEDEHRLQWFITPDKTARSSVVSSSHPLLQVCAVRSLAFNVRSDVDISDGVTKLSCDELPDKSYVIPIAFSDDTSFIFVSLQVTSEHALRYSYVCCECLRVAMNAVIVHYNHIAKDALIRKHSQLKYVLAKYELRVRVVQTADLSAAFHKWCATAAMMHSTKTMSQQHQETVHVLEHKLRMLEANDADWAEIVRGMTGAAVQAHDGVASLWSMGCRSLTSLVASHVTVRGCGLIIRDVEDIYELEVKDAATPAPVSPATPHYSFFEHHVEPGAAALNTVSINAMDVITGQLVNNIFHTTPSSQQWAQRMWKLKRSEYDDDQVWFVPLRTSTELIGILRISVHLTLGSDVSRDDVREETAQRVYLNFAEVFSSLVVIAQYVQDAKQECNLMKDEMMEVQRMHKHSISEFQQVNTAWNMLSSAIESCATVCGELDDAEITMGLVVSMAQRVSPVLSMNLGCRVEILPLGSKIDNYDIALPILTSHGESFATLCAELRENMPRNILDQVLRVLAITLGSMRDAMQNEMAAKHQVTSAVSKLRSMEEEISEYAKLVDEISMRELICNDKYDTQKKMCEIFTLCVEQQQRLLRMYNKPLNEMIAINDVLCSIAKKLPELCQATFVCSFGLLSDAVVASDAKSYLDMSVVWYHAEPQSSLQGGVRLSERANQISMNLATACMTNKEVSVVDISSDKSMGSNGLKVTSYPLLCDVSEQAVGVMQLYSSALSTHESCSGICEEVAKAVAHMVFTYKVVGDIAKKEVELSTNIVVKEHALDDSIATNARLQSQVEHYCIFLTSLQKILSHCKTQNTLMEAIVQEDALQPFERSGVSVAITSSTIANLHDDTLLGSVRIGHERNEVLVAVHHTQRSEPSVVQDAVSLYLLAIKSLDAVMLARYDHMNKLQVSQLEHEQQLQKIENHYTAEIKKIAASRKNLETQTHTASTQITQLQEFIKASTFCSSSLICELGKLFKKYAEAPVPSLSSLQQPEKIINSILRSLQLSLRNVHHNMHVSILLSKTTHVSTVVMFDGTNESGVRIGDKRSNETSMVTIAECLQSRVIQKSRSPFHQGDVAGVTINCDNAGMFCVPIEIASDVRALLRVVYHDTNQQCTKYLLQIVEDISNLICPLMGSSYLKFECRKAADEATTLVNDMKTKIDYLETCLSRARRIHRVACREVGALLDPPVVDMGKENVAPQHPAALTPVVAAQDICMKILSIIRSLVRSEGQALLLRDEDTEPVTYQLIYAGSAVSWTGVEAGSFGVITAPPSGNCLVEQVMKSHKSLSLPDIVTDHSYWPPVDGQCIGNTPALLVPVRGRGNSVVGVIIAVRGKEASPFTQEDITAAEIAAGFASQSLYWCYGVGALHIKLTKTIAKVEELEQHIRSTATKRESKQT